MTIKLLLLLILLNETDDRESLRFLYSTEQGFDTSCGLTTLSCLMERYWLVPADEISLVTEFLFDKIGKGDYTVSFADMTAILKARGFVCKAYQMSFEELEKAVGKYAPVIVHYDRPEGHFALVLGMRDGMILTADPAEGTIARGRISFESRWSGKVLIAVLPGGTPDTALMAEAETSALGRAALLEHVTLLVRVMIPERAAPAGSGVFRW